MPLRRLSFHLSAGLSLRLCGRFVCLTPQVQALLRRARLMFRHGPGCSLQRELGLEDQQILIWALEGWEEGRKGRRRKVNSFSLRSGLTSCLHSFSYPCTSVPIHPDNPEHTFREAFLPFKLTHTLHSTCSSTSLLRRHLSTVCRWGLGDGWEQVGG